MIKIAIILGTRPEIIKLSPIIRYCVRNKIDHFIIHTNQHFSKNMDAIFFKELQLPKPRYNLNINRCSHAVMTGRMLIAIEKVFIKECPDVVLVQGDTNTVLAGALCAAKLGIKIGHVEAGLRSYDRKMPEEINRIVADKISDFLFCPTDVERNILLGEGTPKEKIFVVGNTIVDSIMQNMKIVDGKIKTCIKGKPYLLLTLHREENIEKTEIIKKIFYALKAIYKKYKIRIIFPAHPRTRDKIKKIKLTVPGWIKIMPPQGYFEFLALQKNASLVLTDSGGVQEEACILKIPCVTLRNNTERPSSVFVGGNIIAGYEPLSIANCVEKMMGVKTDWENPFGDGRAGERLMRILINNL